MRGSSVPFLNSLSQDLSPSPFRASTKHPQSNIENNVSSLYQPDPLFGMPVIRFEDQDPNSRWESIAKEILTPFAPKYAIYDYKKFLPDRSHASREGPTNQDENLVQSKAFVHTASLKRNPSTRFSEHNKNKAEEKNFNQSRVSFAFAGSPFAAETTHQSRFFDISPFGKSLTWRIETPRLDTPVDSEKSLSIKRFLVRKKTPRSTPIDALKRQSQDISRPQSARADIMKAKMMEFLQAQDKDNIVEPTSMEISRLDQGGLMQNDAMKSSCYSISEEKVMDGLTIARHNSVNKLSITVSKPPKVLERQSSKKSLSQNDRPLIGPFQSQKEEKSQDNSIRNDSKYSFAVMRAFEVDSTREIRDSLFRNHIRRKSDTSQYSGGVCLKLAKHSDIMLQSDMKHNKKVEDRSEEKQGSKTTAFFTKLMYAKQFSSKVLKKKDTKVQNSPQASPHNGLQPDAFISNPVIETVDCDLKDAESVMLPDNKVKNHGVNLEKKGKKQRKVPQIKIVSSIDRNFLTSHALERDRILRILSKTPRPQTESEFDKAPRCLTQRDIENEKVIFENRLRQGDLKDAYKTVLNLNKKAEKTIFKLTDKNLVFLKSPKASSRGATPVSTRPSSLKDFGFSNPSPYVQPVVYKKEEVKTARVISSEQRKDRNMTTITPASNMRKTTSAKIGTAPVTQRSQSVSKVTGVVLLKV